MSPDLVLEGPEPRLLDEWQIAPDVWNHVRRSSDTGQRNGRFILTGSAMPSDDATRHTGAGRVSRLLMRPMSLFESGHSSGAISIGALLASAPVSCPATDATLTDLIEFVCRGGWPDSLDTGLLEAQQFASDYMTELCRADIEGLNGRRRDPARILRLLRSLARNTATEASIATLAADTGGEQPLHVDTVRSYLDFLERVFAVEDQPAWSVRLRSRSRLRHASKKHFVDPSLAVAALEANPQRLQQDLSLFGLLFESLAVRDVRVYAGAHRGVVLHYRDNTGLEVDLIIETGSGAWMGFEVKLGGPDAIDSAAQNLLRLKTRVDTDIIGEPAKLGVITGSGYGYDRPDGIAVIPITSLGP